ncbi:hypothetical protein [Cellvibrio fibrivorans]|uniref:Esterase n=1 Tax=Cellvibrio fibrivorans TaxID=126350 RepID=A0ABU1V079_9GAMM|nr:hypothetical protein [Cellvibrio fibrivorans]MDR7090831.1 hypothetical protein [Cellvibrio fibrivorans]
MRKVFFGLFVSSVLLTNAAYGEELSAFELPLTEVKSIHAESNNKDYELYIQLPASYKNLVTTYPLIIVND